MWSAVPTGAPALRLMGTFSGLPWSRWSTPPAGCRRHRFDRRLVRKRRRARLDTAAAAPERQRQRTSRRFRRRLLPAWRGLFGRGWHLDAALARGQPERCDGNQCLGPRGRRRNVAGDPDPARRMPLFSPARVSSTSTPSCRLRTDSRTRMRSASTTQAPSWASRWDRMVSPRGRFCSCATTASRGGCNSGMRTFDQVRARRSGARASPSFGPRARTGRAAAKRSSASRSSNVMAPDFERLARTPCPSPPPPR